jgi:hypothetical protein
MIGGIGAGGTIMIGGPRGGSGIGRTKAAGQRAR